MDNLKFLDKTSRKRLSWGKAGQKNLYPKTFIYWARNLATEPKITFLRSLKLHYSSHLLKHVTLHPPQCWFTYHPFANICESQHWGRREELHSGKSKKAWNEKSSCTFSVVFQRSLTSIVGVAYFFRNEPKWLRNYVLASLLLAMVTASWIEWKRTSPDIQIDWKSIL